MTFANMLSGAIEISKLKLKDIAELCMQEGVTIDPSYISKLHKGKVSPPSDDIVKALCKVLNANEVDFLIQSHIEKFTNFNFTSLDNEISLKILELRELCEKIEIAKNMLKKYEELNLVYEKLYSKK